METSTMADSLGAPNKAVELTAETPGAWAAAHRSAPAIRRCSGPSLGIVLI